MIQSMVGRWTTRGANISLLLLANSHNLPVPVIFQLSTEIDRSVGIFYLHTTFWSNTERVIAQPS
jgi:hypothetical protein